MEEKNMNINLYSDIQDITEKKPKKLYCFFLVILFLLLIVFFAWSFFAVVEEKITLNGNISSNEQKNITFSEIDGKIIEVLVKDGDVVERGDEIIKFNSDTLYKEKEKLEKACNDLDQELVALNAYKIFISKGKEMDLSSITNEYIKERINSRRNIYKLNVEKAQSLIIQDKKNLDYKQNTLNESINYYEKQLKKLEKYKKSILNKKNEFNPSEDSYYYISVEEFIKNFTSIQDNFDKQINILENKELAKQLEIEKNNKLNELVNKELKTIENSIMEVKNTKNSLSLNINEITSQNENLINYNDIEILRNNELKLVIEEIQTMEGKCKEALLLKNSLVGNINKCTIKASDNGIINFKSELFKGQTILNGQDLYEIIDQNNDGLYITTFVPEKEIDFVKKDEEVLIKILIEDEEVDLIGFIIEISPNIKYVSEEICYYQIKINIPKEQKIIGTNIVDKIKIGKKTNIIITKNEKTIIRKLIDFFNKD